MGTPQNTYRNAKQPQPVKTAKAGTRFSAFLAFLKDRRTHLTFGIFLLFFSFWLLFALVSHIFTGRADQSLMLPEEELGLRDAGHEVENWMGYLGAWTSNWLMFRGFGVAAILFAPLVFAAGYKIVFRLPLLGKGRPFARVVAFSLVWIATVLGLVVSGFHLEINFSWLCGAVGYEIADILKAMLSWGAWFVPVLSLAAFAIYFYNVTSLGGLRIKLQTELDSINNINKLETDFAHQVKSPSPTAPLDEMVDEDEGDGFDEDDEPLSPATPPIVMSDGITFELKTPTAPSKTQPKAEPVFEVNVAPPQEEYRVAASLQDQPVMDFTSPEAEFEVAEPVEETFDKHLENYDPTLDLSTYRYPVLDLLNDFGAANIQVDTSELESNKDTIIHTLKQFGIGIASIKATVGPTVTLYEIVPDAGIRITKIKNLEDDIALSLAALGIRIIAPMPGKGTIGIEVPNKKREMVSIRTVLSTEKFMKSDMALPVALGKTISNEVFITDLAKMPHLLMAGATGQGKSVGLNVLLTSLIYKKHPSQLKFVLVDPKKVELSVFSTIERHFLAKLPNSEEAIITDTKKVVYTLNSLCILMDQRYDLLKDAGCRNLKEYNQKFTERRLNPEKGHQFMPYIVLVIDELADLMMTAGKEVELPIARLAQLARAVGIHLVVATQRPSVNVITGIIKANFPARLSFKVTSKIDSRTILDAGGAEQLIGNGDMLLSMGSDVVRLQCAFIDTPEVERICDFIGSQRGYPTAYHLPEFVGDDEDDGDSDFDPVHRDAMFDDAARMIVTHQQGSTSLLQRKLKLGYARAGRLMDQLEAAGIVGPFTGSKAREVMMKDPHSLEQFLKDLDG